MSAKLLMFFAFIYFVGTFLCLSIEGEYYQDQDMTIVNQLTGVSFIEAQDAGPWAIPKMAVGFFTNGIPKLILWNYTFLQGGYEIVKWLLLYPLTVGFIWGLAQTFIGMLMRQL